MCGCTPEELVRVAELLCDNSGRERTSAIVYALGWTQHTTGVQIIRTAGILQLLLGQHGPARRRHHGHARPLHHPGLDRRRHPVRRCCPATCRSRPPTRQHETLDSYVEHEGLPTGYWANFRKFIVSLLKAWYGDAATPDNDFRFAWLPRVDGDYSQLAYFDRMARGEVKGYFLFGQNPGGGGPNAGLHRAGLRNLDWLVVARLVRDRERRLLEERPERAAARRHQDRGLLHPGRGRAGEGGQPHQHPAAAPVARQGARPARRLPLRRLVRLQPRQAPQGSFTPARPTPGTSRCLHLTWDYDFDELRACPTARSAASRASRTSRRSSGDQRLQARTRSTRARAGRSCCRGFSELKDDGTTACGCWIYSGVFPEPGRNRAARAQASPTTRSQPEWGFAWPDNRRVLYNRASADPEGRPWSERKKLIWWDEERRRWVGPRSCPTSSRTSRPTTSRRRARRAWRPSPATQPFIMKPDGLGWLFAPAPSRTGRCRRTTSRSSRRSATCSIPGRHAARPSAISRARSTASPTRRRRSIPVVATTFRLTEHYLSGPMSRFNSWLNELQPEMFVELSPELAAERGIEHGGWLTVDRRAAGSRPARW